MKKYVRKIVLLSCIAVLLCIYIVQLVLSGKSSMKDMTMECDVDEITVVSSTNGLQFVKEADGWKVGHIGESLYTASSPLVDGLVEDVLALKLLAPAAKSLGGDAERYGLDAGTKITVKVMNSGNVERTLLIGKSSSTNQQNYVQLDDDSAVYIVGGRIRSDFEKSLDDFRSKLIYSINSNDIEKVSVTIEDFTYVASKDASQSDGDNLSKPTWTLLEGALSSGYEVDMEKLGSWVPSLNQLSAVSWSETQSHEGEELEAHVVFTAKGKDYVIDLYSNGGEDASEKQYSVTCSETPYRFVVDRNTAQRIKKNLEGFVKI